MPGVDSRLGPVGAESLRAGGGAMVHVDRLANPAAWAVAVLAALGATGCRDTPATAAATLVASVPYDIETLDPHARDLVGQFAVGAHIFEPLVSKDAEMRLQPRLATRWINPDPHTWVFELRPGVRFHDGRPFESADVAYSLRRLMSDSSLEAGVYVSQVSSVEAVEPLKVVVRTHRPASVLLNKLSSVLIVPRGATPRTLAENPLGTGPYRLAGWSRGTTVALLRHDGYWGPKPAIERVLLRLARSPEEGLKDLLSSESDLAHLGSRAADEALAQRPDVRRLQRTGIFLKYLGFDLARERTPYASPAKNPFLDLRVRQAVSLALDRAQLSRSLPAFATPASQIVPPSIFGFDPTLPVLVPDLARARDLMRQAGHADGFDVTLHARRIVGQGAGLVRDMLGPIGIRVTVVELGEPEFFAAVAEGPSFFLSRYGCDTGDAADVLNAGLHTVDSTRRFGTANHGRFSNRDLDAEIESSSETIDVTVRRRQLARIMRTAMTELAWVPLYFDEDVYAIRDAFQWQPRADSYVLAEEVTLRPR